MEIMSTHLTSGAMPLTVAPYTRLPIAIALSLAAAMAYGSSSPITGSWRAVAGNCEPAAIPTASCGYDANALGPDEFLVQVLTKGHLVCGIVDSSATYGKRTDVSFFVGKIRRGIAVVEFESTRVESPQRGTARLSIKRGKLKWHVTRRIYGAYTWDVASAKRAEWPEDDHAGLTAWCSTHWKAIETGNTGNIELHQ